MDAFLELAPQHQAELLERAADELGLAPSAVEKDLWVCWVLRELFRMEGGEHLTFKGGTSLSKCWGLIQRFSEDIDLVVDRAVLGFDGDAAPEAGKSRRERERRAESVVAACRRHVGDVLLLALATAMRNQLGQAQAPFVALDPEDGDQQTILFSYPSRFSGAGYLRPVVKIELGARSDPEPNEQREIRPYVASAASTGMDDYGFRVRAVAPERTFWEKVSLQHEVEGGATGSRVRLSRHYYDLWCLELKQVAASAFESPELFQRVVQHRRLFFRRSAAAQSTLALGTVRIVPAAERMSDWRADFEAMRETMFFEEPPSFDAIMEVARELEQRINQLGQSSETVLRGPQA